MRQSRDLILGHYSFYGIKKFGAKGILQKRLSREIYRGFRSKMAISSLITERQPETALQVVVLIGR